MYFKKIIITIFHWLFWHHDVLMIFFFSLLQVYMTYVQAMYGGGGWPLSVFLSPDLKPLMGGTYFPPDDKFGRPGFKTILR